MVAVPISPSSPVWDAAAWDAAIETPVRDELVRVVREFTGTILNPYDPQDLLHRLTRQSMEVVGASGCGILLENRQGDLSFAAASEDRIVEIELFQERVNQGACFDAYKYNELVRVDDIGEAVDRWPTYVQRVRGIGMGAVLGVPMHAYGRTIGVMNIYREAPTGWTDEDIEAAEIMAAMGAGYIIYASDLRAQFDLTQQLQAAIDSRDTIGQAKGIVMARNDIEAEDAFTLLRDASQQLNQKLHDVAQQVVEGRLELIHPDSEGQSDHAQDGPQA